MIIDFLNNRCLFKASVDYISFLPKRATLHCWSKQCIVVKCIDVQDQMKVIKSVFDMPKTDVSLNFGSLYIVCCSWWMVWNFCRTYWLGSSAMFFLGDDVSSLMQVLECRIKILGVHASMYSNTDIACIVVVIIFFIARNNRFQCQQLRKSV